MDGAGCQEGAAVDRGLGHERPEGHSLDLAADRRGRAIRRLAASPARYRAQLQELKTWDAYSRTILDPKTRPQSGFIGWFGIQYASQQINTLRCGYSFNLAHFCDRGVDRRAARALSLFATVPESAASAWAQLDRELVDQAPLVPLFNPRFPWLASKRVGNWQYHPYSGVLLDQLWVN